MRFRNHLILPFLTLLLLAACKPTEKNYRNAYEKAYSASQRKAQEENVSFSGGKLEKIDGPRTEVIDGDTLYIGQELVRLLEPQDSLTQGKVGIAIARYSMPTNAKRHAEEMKKEYPEAFVSTDGHDNYYVMIKRVPGVNEAISPVRIFTETHPGYRYIGFGDRPRLYFIND